MNKNRNKQIISISMACLLLLSGCGDSELKLKKESFQVEYGKTISTNVKDYIDTKDKDILKESKISFKDAKNEKDKTYPKVGTYHG
ncbi:MAG: hypothetical protein RSC93_08600, partial [Erysipelotrichaceae bacterium]